MSSARKSIGSAEQQCGCARVDGDAQARLVLERACGRTALPAVIYRYALCIGRDGVDLIGV